MADQLTTQSASPFVETDDYTKKIAEGDFSDDPSTQYYNDQLELIKKRNEILKQATEQKFTQNIDDAMKQGEQLSGSNLSRLSKLGGINASAAAVGSQTGLEQDVNKGVQNLKTNQSLELSNIELNTSQQELDAIQKMYGENVARQVEAIKMQKETEKFNAQQQLIVNDQKLAEDKFKEDVRQFGVQIAQQNALSLGFAYNEETGQLEPTLEKQRDAQQKIDQDRRYSLDVDQLQLAKDIFAFEKKAKTGELTGDFDGQQTIGSQRLDLDRDSQSFTQDLQTKQFDASESQRDFENAFKDKGFEEQKRATNFSEALQEAQRLIDEKLANSQISKTDADIATQRILTELEKRKTDQSVKESDVDIANKIAQNLRDQDMFPLQMEALKSNTALTQAQTQATISSTALARAKSVSGSGGSGSNGSVADSDIALLNTVLGDDGGFDLLALSELSQKDKDRVYSAYNEGMKAAGVSEEEALNMTARQIDAVEKKKKKNTGSSFGTPFVAPSFELPNTIAG